MSYILQRTRINERQMYMDRFHIDGAGEWRDPLAPYSGLALPLQFERKYQAKWCLEREEKKDPNWHYDIKEYLQ